MLKDASLVCLLEAMKYITQCKSAQYVEMNKKLPAGRDMDDVNLMSYVSEKRYLNTRHRNSSIGRHRLKLIEEFEELPKLFDIFSVQSSKGRDFCLRRKIVSGQHD